MAIIGRNDITTAGECVKANSMSTTVSPRLSDQRTRTAVANEVVTLVGFYSNVSYDSSTMAIALYDITSGLGSSTVAYSTTITGSPFTTGWQTKVVSWPLTAGNKYAIAVAVTSGTQHMRSTDWISGINSQDTTKTGATVGSAGWPVPWHDTAYTYDMAVYASTEISASDPTITFSDTNGNSDCVDLASSPVAGTVDVSVFEGATLAALGSAPDFEGSMVLDASGEGVLTMTGSSLLTGADVHVRIKEPGTLNQAAYFTTVD